MLKLHLAKDLQSTAIARNEHSLLSNTPRIVKPILEGLHVCTTIMLEPETRIRRQWNVNGEIVVSVHTGIIRCVDSTGTSEDLRSGEFRKSSIKIGDGWIYCNESLTQKTYIVEIVLSATHSTLVSNTELKRFTAAQRRGTLCLVASAGGPYDLLRLTANARLYSAILLPGQHVVHELSLARRVWIQVVEGALTIDNITVMMGNGVVVTNERALSIRAEINSELILVELGQ